MIELGIIPDNVIVAEEWKMKKLEWWTMYFETQRLKELGLKISQIARALSLSRNTVYRYLEMDPEALDQERERRKKLDVYTDEIVSWLKKYPDLSAAQIEDWLEEKNGKKVEACESTVRNFVRELRKKHNIPKIMYQRDYQASEELPMGQQAQVDFGEIKLLDPSGNPIKLWFIGFVLAHSRYKYVEWFDRPFTTREVIRTHENAFSYFGGKPKQMVYDQDHLILVHENYGDLIFTQEFAVYVKRRNFQVHMCRKVDPESKGQIENVVGFVKKNFARHRIYYSLDKLNEECLAWLERRGNGKVHQTTKKNTGAHVPCREETLTADNRKINFKPYQQYNKFRAKGQHRRVQRQSVYRPSRNLSRPADTRVSALSEPGDPADYCYGFRRDCSASHAESGKRQTHP